VPPLTELRPLLRAEEPLAGTVLLARGGPDTFERLRKDASRTARRFSLDGSPLLGVSVAAAVDVPLDDLLGDVPFVRFAEVYTPTVSQLRAFELLPTFRRPHFTVRLQRADEPELDQLLSALGSLRANPRYARGTEGY
jgi:hypothetical protein